jgi:threonine/homoserine/homoserine lactone efflux protein
MFGIHDYWLFVSAGVLLNLTPGQDTMFIIGRSLTGGLKSGIAAAFGIAIGTVFHTLAVALGLAAILATSVLAFTVVKLLGAAYLVYLGARLLLARTPASPVAPASGTASPGAASPGAHSALLQGALTNMLNPKVALFFLAFLPQFIDPASHARTLAFLTLGATFITTGLSWCLVIAVAAARLQAFFLRNPNVRTWIDRAVGGLFLGLGARLAWSR